METGLAEIRDLVAAGGAPPAARPARSDHEHDVLEAYAAHLLSLAPVDAAAGSRSWSTPATAWPATPRPRSSAGCRDGQVELVPMYFELDGTFPHHEANPIEPANLRRPPGPGGRARAPTSAWPSTATPTAASSSTSGATPVSPSDAHRADRRAASWPRSRARRVIHNLITSRAVPEIVRELGGVPVRTRVGHSFIKATMAETDAIFGGEHSGHFYFRDFWRADSGMLAALHALAALAETDRPLSELLAEYERYAAQRRDQLRGRRPGGGARRASRRRTPAGRRRRSTASTGSPSATPTGLQRATLQHRAAAAAQRRGPRPAPPWREVRDDRARA